MLIGAEVPAPGKEDWYQRTGTLPPSVVRRGDSEADLGWIHTLPLLVE